MFYFKGGLVLNSKKYEFSEKGFVVEGVEGCKELIQECLKKITILASDGVEMEFRDFNHLGELLSKVFNQNKEAYTGLLKAFANSPAVQSFATLPSIVSFAQDLGIREPSLVTPPILHVVKDNLILNREKVFTPAHQDVVSTKGSVGQLVFWIPLHDIDLENYGIEAWPGSHLLGELPSDESGFGHTVSKNFVPGEKPVYLKMNQGQVVAFSQYLIHQTYTRGNFRLAVSFRFNDALDPGWVARNYFSAFDRVANTRSYDDKREKAPKDTVEYFKSFKNQF